MTVIAFDGRTLAADRRGALGGFTFSVQKLYVIEDRGAVASSGEHDKGLAMIDWFRRGANPAEFPASQIGEDWSRMLHATPDGRLFIYEQTPYPIECLSGQFACGSGADFALAAMHLGKSAVEAVEVACALDTSCGNGWDIYNCPNVHALTREQVNMMERVQADVLLGELHDMRRIGQSAECDPGTVSVST